MKIAEAAQLPRIPKYDVIEEVGHGGMATVYRALDLRLGREVAPGQPPSLNLFAGCGPGVADVVQDAEP